MRALLGSLGRVSVPILLSALLCTAIFALTGYDVVQVGAGIVEGAITGEGAFLQTLRWTMPLLVIALGFMFSSRAGEFNVGGQGQLMVGGLCAVAVALSIGGPPLLIVPMAIAAGMAGGMAWSAIAGALKLQFGADEVIVTLMLNFIATLFVQWVTTGPLKDPAVRGENASTSRIDVALRLSDSSGVSISVLVILALCILVAWLLAERTSFGLQARYVGSNARAALWQGIRNGRVRMMVYLVAGAFAGLAGALEVLGPNGKMVTGATPGIGFTAIVVAIVGQNRVGGIVLAALLFGGVQAAVLFLPIVSDLPASGLHILEGMIAALVTARFVWLRFRRGGKA